MINKPRIYKRYNKSRDYVLYLGDCYDILKKIEDEKIDLTVTSPPYYMGKEYDSSKNVKEFEVFHSRILPEIVRITKPGGSICWQVGYHVEKGVLTPLDCLIHEIMREFNDIFLRNRIVWTYGHGLHSNRRFSGRHETILWYTKGKEYFFDLDSVRIPQKYPGKKYYKGNKRGKYSGNPLGKNPSDVWDIPNVKANHIEKTEHPCQFPVALVQRLINSLSPPNGVVLDPFIGSGTTGIAAIIEKRKLIGCETQKKYYNISMKRCMDAINNKARIRPLGKPVLVPNPLMSVAIAPPNFRK